MRDNFDRRLGERIVRHREERARTSQAIFETSPDGVAPSEDLRAELPFEEAVAAYDAWVARRIAAWRGEARSASAPATPEAPPATAAEPWRRGRVQSIRRLADMDRLMLDAFALREFMPTCVAELPPLTICPTVEDFAASLGDFLPGYRAQFPRWMDHVCAAPGQVLPGNPLSKLALHLPGRGTYVNGLQILSGRHDDLAAAWRDRATLRRAVRAVAGERWGHGFIERYTALGQDLRSMNLSALYLAQRLALPPLQQETRMEKTRALSEGALITSRGWAVWIGEYLAQRAQSSTVAPPDREHQIRLAQLWDALKRLFRVVPLESWAQILGTPIPGLDRLVQGFQETLNWLLLNTDMDFRLINRYVRICQRMLSAPELRARQVLDVPWSEAFMRMCFNNLEARLGVMPIPYAVLIAANVAFDPQWSAGEIRRWIDGDARQNVDARLMMLARLDPAVKHNVSTLVSTAVHSLGMRPPEDLKWT